LADKAGGRPGRYSLFFETEAATLIAALAAQNLEACRGPNLGTTAAGGLYVKQQDDLACSHRLKRMFLKRSGAEFERVADR
jgi:hypothetical protein